MVGLLVLSGGFILLALALAADSLELGSKAGAGGLQMLAAVLGLVLMTIGGALAFRVPERTLPDLHRVSAVVAYGVPPLLYLLGVAWVFQFHIDDSYISMRYAANLAAGDGLVFNAGGARIEGYTNLLLVVLEAVLIRLGAEGLEPVKVLLIGCGLGVIVTMTWYGRRLLREETTAHWVPVVVALLVATSAPFVLWTVSGLETALFVFLVCLGVVAYLLFLNGLLGGRKVLFVDLALLLAVMARPEGFFIWAATAFHTVVVGLIRKGTLLTRARVAGILVSFCALCLYAMWKLAYFGQLLPATYSAKRVPLNSATWSGGIDRLQAFLAINGHYFVVLFIVAGLILATLRRKGIESSFWYVAGLAVGYLAYVVSLGFSIAMDDAYRFYVPLIPLLSLLLIELAFALRADMRRIPLTGVASCLLGLTLLVPLRIQDLGQAWTVDFNWGVLPYQIAARDVAVGLERGHVALGRWLREHASPDATIVLHDAGAVPYFSGLRTIDTWSLTDPELLTMKRALASATSEPERQRIRSEMRAYVLAQKPDYIVQDNLSLLRDPLVQEQFRPTGEQFVYLDDYECGQGQKCQYVLKPWERRGLE